MESIKIDNTKVKRILIVRSDGLGDFILSLSALNLIRTSFPKAHIVLFTGSWQEEIARSTKLFDEIIVWDGVTNYYFSSPRKLKYLSYRIFKFLPILKSRKFDVAIDFRTNNFINRIVIYLGGAKKRIGFNRGGLGFLLNQIVKDREDVHKSLCFLDLVASITDIKEDFDFTLQIPQGYIKRAEDFLNNKGITNKDIIVVIHPVARWPAKAWPKEKFARLSEQLLGLGRIKVVLIGAKEDLPRINEIENMMTKKPIISAGRLSFMETAALIKEAKLVIGNDGAPAHLAGTFNIPTIALFGPTDPKVFSPVGTHSIVIHKIDKPCAGCSKKYCLYPEHFCMDKISVEEVFSICKQNLNGARPG